MYNTEFVCTYVLYDFSLIDKNPHFSKFAEKTKEELNGMNETELREMSDFLYKNELLFGLGLEKYDDEEVKNRIEMLFYFVDEKITNSIYKDDYLAIIEKAGGLLLSEDPVVGFQSLFSYDYFHLIHGCIIDLFKTGEFNEVNILALKNCF